MHCIHPERRKKKKKSRKMEINVMEVGKFFVITSRESLSLGSKGDTAELSEFSKHFWFVLFVMHCFLNSCLVCFFFLTWSEFHTITVQFISSWVLMTSNGPFISTSHQS